MRARVLIRPKEGILDPQGIAVERALPALGFSGVENVHVGRLVELDVEDASQLDAMCEKLLANPLIEDYEIVERESSASSSSRAAATRSTRWHAAQRVGDAELLWHGDHDLQGVDAVIVPGGFSYGDYLRVGAIARFSPVMESVIAFARRRRARCSGICNGFQVLCEAHLLPGALLPNTSLRFICRQVDLEVVDATPRSRARASAGASAVDPGQAHHRPLLRAAELDARRQVVLRYATGQNPNGSQDDIAGVCNEAGNVFGPDAPPRARGRPADRLDRRAAPLRVDACANVSR